MEKTASYINRLQHFIAQDTQQLPWLQSTLILFLRGAYALWRDISQGQLTLRAMSLSFTTLLSMVPLLALSFSVLKGFGIHNTLEPILTEYLAPLGDRGVEMSNQIVDFVSKMNVGVLGFLGLGLLLYTVVSLVQKIEEAFNYIWHVSESRSLSERFRDYLSAVLIGPVVMIVAFGLSASVKTSGFVQYFLGIDSIGALILMFLKLIPFFMVIGAFTFIYSFIPNTPVKTRAAFIGAVIAGILWQSAGWGFTSFVASSSKYTAIYSSFAVLILFLIWLHVSWMLVLIGANLSYYCQHPEQLLLARDQLRPSYESHERLALQVMYLIAQAHDSGRASWTLKTLSDRLFIPQRFINDILDIMQRASLLEMTASEPPAFLPSRSIDGIKIKDVLSAVRQEGDDYRVAQACDPIINQFISAMEKLVYEKYGEQSLKQFITHQTVGEDDEIRVRAVSEVK